MRRIRAVDAPRRDLPENQEDRAEVLASVINSPRNRSTLESMGIVNTQDQTARARVANAIMEDLSTAVSATKTRRNNDSTLAVRVGLSLACGEAVHRNRLTGAVANELNINRRRVADSIQRRHSVLTEKSGSWLVTERKTRSDAVSEEHRKLAHDFWSSPEISRPTGNKKDFIRQRFGLKEYIHHEKQIMSTIQTEAFLLVKEKYPEIKIGQRCFEKVVVGKDANGKEKKKLKIVTKETPPSELFNYFLFLLKFFPAHQFRAGWQHQQMQDLKMHLPLNEVICVHDYSENYTCQDQDQSQSSYYGQTQVSIHVTILHRHAISRVDGTQSTLSDPHIVTEHLFAISDDLQHDHQSVHNCRKLVANYLKSIGCQVDVMHEWTDGCSAQYKSRHCMGDVSYSMEDFSFRTIRNYFETSHAKGPQDGAGANLKHKAEMEVIRRNVRIQSAKDLYEFAMANLQEPAPTTYQASSVKLARRVFFYIDKLDPRQSGRRFKEIKGNRAIHSIMSGDQGCELSVRRLSCYCDECLEGMFIFCHNKNYVEQWEDVQMEQESTTSDRSTRSAESDSQEMLKDLVVRDTIVAIASGDVDEDYYLTQS